MKLLTFALIAAPLAFVQDLTRNPDEAPGETPPVPAISHRVETNSAGERTLIEEVYVDAPVARVWRAYTTSAGMQAWGAPVVEVDLRAGGTIKSNYDPAAKIGDPGTNTLHIVNWVPERLLTLRADLTDNWPEVMRKDAGKLMNIVVFEALGPERTKIESYGVGYGDAPEYEQLLGFFAEANAGLYRRLKQALETGE